MLKNHTQNNIPVGIRTDLSPAQPAGALGHPQGEAAKLNKIVSDNWAEHLALFSGVDNHVIKANPNVHAPFYLEVGEPSPLGLFAESAFSNSPSGILPGKYALEYQYGHDRSSILARVTFQDKEGRVYRDVDLKGTGAVSPDDRLASQNYTVNVRNPGECISDNNYEGLLSRDIALYDYKMTEQFMAMGIGTCRVLGIIELHEIIARRPSMTRPWQPRTFTTENIFEIGTYPAPAPEKLSLKEAVEEGIIAKNFHPVIEVRAFLTRARVADVQHRLEFDRDSREMRPDACGQIMLEDARKLAAQLLGLSAPMSKTAYLMWFAQTLGRNVGTMHRNGWEHHYLSDGHNITLTGDIVDLDGARLLESDEKRMNELLSIQYTTLPRFFGAAMGAIDSNLSSIICLVDLFLKSYDKHYRGAKA